MDFAAPKFRSCVMFNFSPEGRTGGSKGPHLKSTELWSLESLSSVIYALLSSHVKSSSLKSK